MFLIGRKPASTLSSPSPPPPRTIWELSLEGVAGFKSDIARGLEHLTRPPRSLHRTIGKGRPSSPERHWPERRGPRPAFEDGKPELTEAPAVACNRPRGNSGRLPLQSAVEGVPREAWSEGDEGRPALRFSLHPLIFPIGRNSATFLVIPARSTASTTSEISL